LKRDQEAIRCLVDNPSSVSSYAHQVDSGDNRVDDRYEYVIITSQELAQHSGEFTFQEFIQYKQAQGVNATLVTTESIYRNPDYWDPRPKYNDRAARIRNFIRHAYVNWHTDYVLLAGDADGDNWQDNIVPARQLFAACIGLPLAHNEELEGYIPADIYYAGLDGTFNADGDERWGENASGNDKGTGDEADLLAEIYIGRICVDSVAEVSNFVRKTISYDTTNDDYLRRVLMVGEFLGFEGAASWGANHMELLAKMLPDWHEITALYEREHNWDSNDLAEFLSNGTHLLHHLGHGWTNHAMKMSSRDAQYLTNDKLFFIYSQTCLAGSFDNWVPGDNYYEQDSFAEAFTCESEHAAFAVIMNSRYGLGRHNSTDSPGQRYHASFIQALNDGYCELGRGNQRSKDTNLWRVDENGMRWIHYEANLIGDPQLAIKGPFMKGDEISIEVVRPTPGILYFGDAEQLELDFLRRPIIIGPVSVEVATKGNISKVNFYLDGKHMATDDTKPYIWQCEMTTWGCHLITAVAIGRNGGTAGHGVETWSIPR
jgi:hypothetical protein